MLKSLTEKAKTLFGPAPRKKQGGTAKRRGDFIMIVCQRNDQRRLEIQAIDSETEKVTGYNNDYLTRRTLNDILPRHINETLGDYLEFIDEGNDLASVLGKVRDFSIIGKDGREIPVNLRIVNTTSVGRNPRFYLIMREVGLFKALGASRDQVFKDLKENQIMDDAVGLLSRDSFIKNFEVIYFFVEKTNVRVCVAIVSIDNFKDIDLRYGSVIGNKIIHDVGISCKSALREEDVIGYLGGNRIGLILFDADTSTAEIPLNRIRWMFNSRTLKYDNSGPINISVSISYANVSKVGHPQDIITRCEEKIDQAGDQGSKELMPVAV